jgi:hypothetical protein
MNVNWIDFCVLLINSFSLSPSQNFFSADAFLSSQGGVCQQLLNTKMPPDFDWDENVQRRAAR